MKERGILFKDRLVKAILDGRKTQTRRVFKGTPSIALDLLVKECPYGEPGDRLWVREAWAPMCRVRDGPGPCCVEPGEKERNHYVEFRADTGNPRPGNWPAEPDPEAPVWKPGIHLFRRDARILLEILEVRLERLNAITASDAIAEGLDRSQAGDQKFGWLGASPNLRRYPGKGWFPRNDGVRGEAASPIDAFASLWDSINGPLGFGWKENPLVWCITFRRVQP